jgi:glycosyltransferase involved in cell wall biosynthesis
VKLSVIVPVFNERQSVENIIKKIKEVPLEKELIVVDDGSTDGTSEILRKIPDIKLILHPKNQGKGSAIRSGLKIATGEFVIIQDADLEYNPADYLRLLAGFTDLKIGAVYGSRFKGNSQFLFLSKLANYILVILTNLLYKAKLSDMETCYKMVRRDVLLSLNLSAQRFEIEPEITAKLLRKRVKIKEVPINYNARKEGKKIGLKDALSAIKELIKWSF